MKKILIILAGFLFSCKNIQQQEITKESEPQLSKLEQLKKHRSDIPLDYIGLSNENLTEMPYLGDYTIKSLNLSHNQIDKLIWAFLPKGIQKLDMSYNSLTIIRGYKNIDYPMKELNVANNNITYISSYSPITRLIATNNNIEEIRFNIQNTTYLDILNNPNFNYNVYFDPNEIDTLLSDKPLKIIKPPRIEFID
ncbi:MAG: hypothetical protein Q4B43_10155 [Bacteroidota bacterium]|nr:hypothetical protein [Bacteroidota bacterium]